MDKYFDFDFFDGKNPNELVQFNRANDLNSVADCNHNACFIVAPTKELIISAVVSMNSDYIDLCKNVLISGIPKDKAFTFLVSGGARFKGMVLGTKYLGSLNCSQYLAIKIGDEVIMYVVIRDNKTVCKVYDVKIVD